MSESFNDYLNEYLAKSKKYGSTMQIGLFAYALFVELAIGFDWDVFFYKSQSTITALGGLFVVCTVAFFPLILLLNHWFMKKAPNKIEAVQKLYKFSFGIFATGEIITFFGLILFLFTANKSYFYLFFVISVCFIFINMPSEKKWSDKISNYYH
jgi:ABC-type multidrug transport system fused ATPase/permease subunit